MRILILSPYPLHPARGGGSLRTSNLLAGLSRCHHLTCLSFVPDAAAATAMAPLREICDLATVMGPPTRSLLRRTGTTLTSILPDMVLRSAALSYRAALSRMLAAEQFDVIHAASLDMAGYALMAREFGSSLIVLDEFNAEYLVQRRAALNNLRWGIRTRRPSALISAISSLIQWRKLVAYESHALREFDRVLVVSEHDRVSLARLWPRADLRVVPNGVDTARFAPWCGTCWWPRRPAVHRNARLSSKR